MFKKLIAAAAAAALGLSAALTSYAAPAGATKVASDSAEAEKLLGYSRASAANTLLGDANYFNVFLTGDYTPTGSDCEGRLAIGGSLNNTEAGENYQVGNGMYGYTAKNTDYADAIVLGGTLNRTAFSFGWKPYEAGGSSGQYSTRRTIVVGENTSVKSGTGAALDMNAEPGSLLYYSPADDPIIDFGSAFSKIRDVSGKFKEMEGTDAALSGSTLTLKADKTTADSGYCVFNVTASQLESAKEVQVNVPSDAYVVMNISGSNVTTYRLDHQNNASYGGGQLKPCFYFNGEQLENNHVTASKVLCNFYEASQVHIVNNFIGTILAPNANVYGDDWGHVSGSLIAQSFYGKTEFGYRPFNAAAPILGNAVIDPGEEDDSSSEDPSTDSDAPSDDSNAPSTDSNAPSTDSNAPSDDSNAPSDNSDTASKKPNDSSTDSKNVNQTTNSTSGSSSASKNNTANSAAANNTATATNSGVTTTTSPETGSAAVSALLVTVAAGLIVAAKKRNK